MNARTRRHVGTATLQALTLAALFFMGLVTTGGTW